MLWLALVLFTAVTVALLRGGRITNLADIHLRMWWLLPFGFLLQATTGFLPDRPWAEPTGVAMILVSYVALLTVVAFNRSRQGMWLAGLGMFLNFAVIAANGGMPVLTEAAYVASGFTSQPDLSEGFKHIVMGPGTRLSFLADVIPLRLFGEGQVLSIGDVMLAVGLARFLEAELRRPVRWFKPGVKLQSGSAVRR